MPLPMCRGREMQACRIVTSKYFVSDYDMKQYVKHFFERAAVLIFKHLEVAVIGATRVKGLTPPKPSHLENLT